MKTEELNEIVSEIEVNAAPYATEILRDAHSFLFEGSSNYIKKGVAVLARSVTKLLSAAYEKDHFEVFGLEVEEWIIKPEYTGEDGEPVFNMPPVVEALVDCVRDLDVDHAWSVPRW